MLMPNDLLRVREYDVTFVVTPTSKHGHNSDTVLATVEMLVENDQPERVTFPFTVLSTDPGTSASPASIRPRVLNGSREVEVHPDEVDEEKLAEVAVARAQAAGVTDPQQLEAVRQWTRDVLRKAERTHRGRTTLDPGEQRRIILQQRLRLRPVDGVYTLEAIVPSPIATLPTGGRISMVVILPFEDDDIRVEVVSRTEGFEVEQGQIKTRKWVAWHWRNDPLLRLQYRYL